MSNTSGTMPSMQAVRPTTIKVELTPLQVWLLSQATPHLIEEVSDSERGEVLAVEINRAEASLRAALKIQAPEYETPEWHCL